MQSRPPFDRELLIPIAVGVVSIIGLAWIFLTNYRSESPIPPTMESTAAPFEASLLETRTLPPPRSETPVTEEASATATGTSPVSYPGPLTETPAPGTLIAKSPPAPLVTPAFDQLPPFPVGKYDDTHPNIGYDRFWAFKQNSGTKFAYKGTLHISASMGSEASFRFTGKGFKLGYQRGKNFGTVTVMIDGQPYSFHEQAFGNIWLSPQLSPGTHIVRIIHENGESINLDYVEVLG